MKSRIIEIAKDEGMPTIIEIDGIVFEAMDCIGYSTSVSNGEEIEVELTIGVEDETESNNDILTNNPKQLKKLQSRGGWSYRAYGEIIAVDPMEIDCGVKLTCEVLDSNCATCIGRYVAFNIERLDVWLKS